jgi:hypothetical protein
MNWIENEGLLRDEGVLFGLSGLPKAQLVHKLNTIKHYFDGQLAISKELREQLDQEQERLKERRKTVAEDIRKEEALAAYPDVPPVEGAKDVDRHTLGRYVIGAIAAIGICVFNFYLVYEQLRPEFESALFVSLGVVLAGLFVVFNPVSLFYTSDATQRARASAAELWKVQLVEFAMPVAAAIFVVSWKLPRLGPMRGVGLFLYLTMLFLFGGKLLLSTLPKVALLVRVMLRAWVVRWRRWQHRRAVKRLREEKLAELDDAAETLLQRRSAIESVSRIEARRDTALELFQSEYDFARQAVMEQHIMQEDIDDILGDADLLDQGVAA